MMTQPRILIAEDELIVAENIARQLRRQGYEVLTIVDSGEDAIQEASQNSPDLILMDIMLQGDLDGIQATEIIRRQLQLPVIYMTAYADDTTLERAKRTEPYGYLVKPFKPHDLKTSIEVALQKYRTDTATQAHYQAQLQDATLQLNRLLYRDVATDLANPLALQKHFQQLLEQEAIAPSLNCRPKQCIPVLYLGLNQLQRVSKHLGQSTADAVLCELAARITPLLGNQGILARMAFNELAIIPSAAPFNQDMEALFQQILQCVDQPVELEQHKFFITGSLGISLYPQDGQDLDTLVNSSRHVMQYLQQAGGGRYQMYAPDIHSHTTDDLALENDLRHALSRQEFHLVFQPQVDLQTGRIIGAEALLRWHHPQRGFVPPNHFIPIAEEAGLIDEIGEWVLRTACYQLQQWRELGMPPLRLSVNISGYQLKQDHLPQIIQSILQETNLQPQYLELELTETMLIANVDLAVQRLQSLREMGLTIAIDDFGTGYSCLSYLHKLPFDTLKLDRSFVQEIHANPKNRAIAGAIISMAHELNLKVIAEGVETTAEMELLKAQGCNEMQGYLFSPALSSDKFLYLVNSGRSLSLEVQF